jgi:hypothetical protein
MELLFGIGAIALFSWWLLTKSRRRDRARAGAFLSSQRSHRRHGHMNK